MEGSTKHLRFPYFKMQGGGLDSSALKLIAIVAMTLDHAAYVFQGRLPYAVELIFTMVGGLTFPIMGFLLAEGYRHTRSVKRYMGRLLVFALITQIPYQMVLVPQLNILFTLFLGLAAIELTERFAYNRTYQVLVAGLIVTVSAACDWGITGVLMVLAYHWGMKGTSALARNGIRTAWIVNLIVNGCVALLIVSARSPQELIPQLMFVLVGGTCAAGLLTQYNGKKGGLPKYFFYAYYPLHIIVLGLLARMG